MHLIEHHHPVAQAPKANEVMPDVERGEQRLIHGADAVGREQRAAALGEPGGRGHTVSRRAINATQRYDLFVEHRSAMHQLHIHDCIAGKAVQKGQGATEQRIAGGLGRQGDIQATMLVSRLQAQMGEKGQLGLALAHGCLDQHQGRPLYTFEQTIGLALQGPGAELGALDDAPDQTVGVGRLVQQCAIVRPTDCRQGLVRTHPRIGVVSGQQLMSLTQGKPFGVGTDPVGHAGQSGQPLHGRLRQSLDLRHALRRQHRPIGIEDFPACLSPDRGFEGRLGAIEFSLAEVIAMVGTDGLQHMAYP
ncbi:hypothetical protein FQZ97_678060 [compost metagenome]